MDENHDEEIEEPEQSEDLEETLEEEPQEEPQEEIFEEIEENLEEEPQEEVTEEIEGPEQSEDLEEMLEEEPQEEPQEEIIEEIEEDLEDEPQEELGEEPEEELDESSGDDDLKSYLAEMEALETDFSDLEDIDMEELQEMQDAIAAVKEGGVPTESAEGVEVDGTVEYLEQKESMISDFSDMDELDFDELRDMQEAIQGVKQEEGGIEGEQVQQPQQVSAELEERIKEELAKRKEVEEDVITPEMFLDYIKPKRDKIWYHALWYITFEVDDHTASKALLYDVLKEDTSKSPIDPIPEHQFYFGLGYILRLNVNKKQIIRYLRGGSFKINVNIDNLKEWLEEAGEPIITKPVIEEEEKKQMYSDFLKDEFLDI